VSRKKKKKRRSRAKTSEIEKIELAIGKAEKRLGEEGNTDEVEDLLDEIEHRINDMKGKGLKRLVIKELKSKLDRIK